MKKRSPGNYQLTVLGTKLFKKIADKLDVCLRTSLGSKITKIETIQIEREAKRPGPRQLVVFNLFCVSWLSENSLNELIQAVSSLMSLLRNYNVFTSISSNGIEHGLVYQGPDTDRFLKHSICSTEIEKHENRVLISIYIGLEVISVIIASVNESWPIEITPAMLEVFIHPSAVTEIKDELLDKLQAEGISIDLVKGYDSHSIFAPGRINVSSGNRPYCLCISNKRYRYKKSYEVIEAWNKHMKSLMT